MRLDARATSRLLERVIKRNGFRSALFVKRRRVAHQHDCRRQFGHRHRRLCRRHHNHDSEQGCDHASAARIAARAACAPATFLPPPCACAAAPPPLPSTAGAAALTRLPACAPAATASSLALANNATLSPSMPTSAITPLRKRERIAFASDRNASALASCTTAATSILPFTCSALSTYDCASADAKRALMVPSSFCRSRTSPCKRFTRST